MKIGLVDCDSHNFPNLPLMKISSYHKSRGDMVEFASLGSHYERLYASKIFTESQEPELPDMMKFSGAAVVMIWKILCPMKWNTVIRITACILRLRKIRHLDF